MKIQAELSLYPLKEPHISEYLEDFLNAIKNTGMAVKVGPMSTIISGESELVFQVLSDAFDKTAEKCKVVLSVKFSNACPCIYETMD